MKKGIILAALLLAVIARPAHAQTFAGNAGSSVFVNPPFRLCLGPDDGTNACFIQNGVNSATFNGGPTKRAALEFAFPSKTIATLPAASSVPGTAYLVTDGQSVSDCTLGGGSTYTFCFSNGSVWRSPGLANGGAASFTTISASGQITSTLATGTAPFSIASTTVVPNLNAQLHNGLFAPASAIVGISDSQTLTSKTLTSPTITNPSTTGTDSGAETLTNKTIDCTANTLSKNPCVVYSTASASTNTTISAVTMATAGGSGNTYRISTFIDQTVLGSGCSTNTVVTVHVDFTDPNAAGGGNLTLVNFSITNNGTVGTNQGVPTIIVRAKASTVVQYDTSVAAGTCTTVPSYQVYPILEQVQ